MSAINILTAKQSLFLNIITVFFGTSGNLLVGTMRKEKLCLSKRLCSSQNLFFTQISCKTEAEQPVLNKLTRPCVTWEPGRQGNLTAGWVTATGTKTGCHGISEDFSALTTDSTAININAPNSYLDSHKYSRLCQELLSLWPLHYSVLPHVDGWGLYNFSLPP